MLIRDRREPGSGRIDQHAPPGNRHDPGYKIHRTRNRTWPGVATRAWNRRADRDVRNPVDRCRAGREVPVGDIRHVGGDGGIDPLVSNGARDGSNLWLHEKSIGEIECRRRDRIRLGRRHVGLRRRDRVLDIVIPNDGHRAGAGVNKPQLAGGRNVVAQPAVQVKVTVRPHEQITDGRAAKARGNRRLDTTPHRIDRDERRISRHEERHVRQRERRDMRRELQEIEQWRLLGRHDGNATIGGRRAARVAEEADVVLDDPSHRVDWLEPHQ